MKTINLNGEWRLSGKQQESEDEPLVLKAEVPGCVQLDLSREGYLPEDLYLGENIKETEKFEDWEWQYERTFTAPLERENVYIVFEGVDCVADYFINGQKIGESKNMLVEHEFEIGKYTRRREKANITFKKAVHRNFSAIVGYGKRTNLTGEHKEQSRTILRTVMQKITFTEFTNKSRACKRVLL